MRVTVYGFGSMGKRRVRHLIKLGAEPQVHDPAVGLGFGTEPGALHRADACIIATPASAHARLLALAVAARVPTLVEKPLALNAAQVADLPLDARGMVGYSLRFHHHVQAMRADLAQAGTPIGAEFKVLVDGSTWPGAGYADALLECSHEIDLALWLLGPARVVAAAQQLDGREWLLRLEHASGVESRVHLSTAHEGYVRSASVLTTRGALRWTWDAPAGLSAYARFGVSDAIQWTADASYEAETREFVSLCRHGGGAPFASPFGATPAEALAVLRICDAAREMAVS